MTRSESIPLTFWFLFVLYLLIDPSSDYSIWKLIGIFKEKLGAKLSYSIVFDQILWFKSGHWSKNDFHLFDWNPIIFIFESSSYSIFSGCLWSSLNSPISFYSVKGNIFVQGAGDSNKSNSLLFCKNFLEIQDLIFNFLVFFASSEYWTKLFLESLGFWY